MCEWLSGCSEAAMVLLSLCIMLFMGFLVTRATRLLRLPNVSGYIIAGILLGPYVLHAVPDTFLSSIGFVSDLALSFIAFGVGGYFTRETFSQSGGNVLVITLFESLTAGVLVALSTHLLFHMDWSFSLLLGAIATATAPASTMMTIRQYQAEGPFVSTLLQVVSLDDAVCLFVFSVAAAAVRAWEDGTFSLTALAMPLLSNAAMLLLGLFCAVGLRFLLRERRSEDNRLILTVAMVLAVSGVCALLDVSPLLACMAMGAGYVNLTGDTRLFGQLDRFTPPILTLFFIVSGMNLNVGALRRFGMVGIGYCLIRVAGKYLGAYAGCAVTGCDASVRNWLGVALVPQAGVAIGLAFLGKRLLPEAVGELLLTVILSSSVLYELIGPASAKAALFCSGAIAENGSKRGRKWERALSRRLGKQAADSNL